MAVARLKTKASEPEVVSYQPEFKTARIRIVVMGKSPLLTHNPEAMGITADAMKGGRIPAPEDEAEAGCYRLPDGTLALKGDAFRGCLLGAAGAWRMKKSSARSRLGHVTVLEELVPLTRHDGTPISDYVIDKRRAIVQRQGILRCRPRMDEWSAAPTFEFDLALVPDPKLIVDILQDGGGRMGVGDYRPQKNGWFGRFDIRSYQIFE